jgi:hypothetical protein
MEQSTTRKERILHLVLLSDGRRLSYYEESIGNRYIYDRGIRIHGTAEMNNDGEMLFIPDTPNTFRINNEKHN